VELDADAFLGVADPAERVDEVHVPRRAPELAIRRRLQPDLLLLAHDVADRLVLDASQLVGADAPGGVLVARAGEPLGAQERADVVGAVGRAGPWGHRSLLGSRSTLSRPGVDGDSQQQDDA
jgi:hypothetical protein